MNTATAKPMTPRDPSHARKLRELSKEEDYILWNACDACGASLSLYPELVTALVEEGFLFVASRFVARATDLGRDCFANQNRIRAGY